MKKVVKVLLVCFVVLSLFGCGEPTFDASSEDAMEKSVELMSADLSPEKKEVFEQNILGMYMLAALATMGDEEDQKMALVKVNEKLNGKTVDEIIALGEELKKEMNK